MKDDGARQPIGFVLATIAIDALGFGMIVPVVPALVMGLSGRGAQGSSFWMGALLAAFSGMQFLCSPLLGGLSDRFGRKPVLLVSLAGICVNNLLLAWAPSMAWLFVGRLVAGATAANFAAASAAIADVSTPEERGRRFGLVGAMFGLGFVVGPAVGGLLGTYGVRAPFVAAAVLAGVNLAYGAVAVRETLAPGLRRGFDWRVANPLGNVAAAWRDRGFLRLAVAWCCAWFALGTLQSSFVLANDVRLGWGIKQNGLALAAAGVGSALVQGLLTNWVIARVGERRAALGGYVVACAAYLAFGAAEWVWVLFVGIGLQALSSVSGPAVQALVSARAGADRQGEMQGALASFQGLTAIGAPLLAGWAFGAFGFPGLPFLLSAAVYGVAFVAVLGLRPVRAEQGG